MTKSREGANRPRKRDYRNSDKTAEPMNMKYLFLAKKHIQKTFTTFPDAKIQNIPITAKRQTDCSLQGLI